MNGQDATFWSSALGTAAGGMVAVWAAFIFWTWDEQRTRNQRIADESKARTQRNKDEQDWRLRALEDRSKEVALQILDRAVAVRALARRIGNTYRDDGQIGDHLDWMKAHAALVQDADLRRNLQDAVDMLNPSASFAQFTTEPYTERVWPVVGWISDMVRSYIRDNGQTIAKPKMYRSLKEAIVSYEAHLKDLERSHQEEMERQVQEAREAWEAREALNEMEEQDRQNLQASQKTPLLKWLVNTFLAITKGDKEVSASEGAPRH